MELPQPRPIRTEGKKPTHDFLSLYSHSSFPDPKSSQGNCLKTHDFLQPLESVSTGEKIVDKTKIERSSPTSSPSIEHILPGGIGTYTISHISNFSQRDPKTEQTIGTVIRANSAERSNEINKTNSSSNSINGGVFAFWEESTMKENMKKGKDKLDGQILRAEASEKLGHWSSEQRPLQPPFHHSTSFNSLSSSNNNNNNNKKAQKSQSFMEMIKSGRGLQEDEEDDDEEFANSSKKSSSSHKDGKSGDQKANTPRSKHSATEQRRRSKINDRFQILREIIPQNDQKRDKASFLLEVIEYIQYLQEKVNRYDTSYKGWNQEPVKLTPWRNGHAPSESVDHMQALKSGPNPALMFTGKFDENAIPNPSVLTNKQNPVDPVLSTSVPFKAIDQNVELASKSVPIPLQPNMFTHSAQPQQPISEDENMVSQPQSQSWPVRPPTTECPGTSDTSNDQEELTIEGGTISFEGVYSQGLLNNLTHALQSSGVDLSQASISVQVDIGKRAINRLNAVAAGAKDDRNTYGNRVMAHSRVESSGDDSDQARKRLRTE